ncbi:hypothetical protein [Aquirhabdus parva]|uniref:Translation elongation factor EFTu/EF1A C-terminal domain-containing protein n=1 Tax=Aquirhabdus parva TaxID=2283318 RepID=A0A345P931_9GAMM|nr:hypothetical protein [Aquirhabdus parva]AXI03790.1 hypothetical protein HYN46_13685 [Aquirhabdus parva]
MKPEITATVKLYATHISGRKSSLLPPYFACTAQIGDAFHDVRVYYDHVLELGQEYTLTLQFLCPELALPKLKIGSTFFLTEGGRKIAACRVTHMLNKHHE